MVLGRAFVLGLHSRAVLAVLVVALSVSYAILVGSLAGGLRTAAATLEPGLVEPRDALALPGLAPFPEGQAPAGSVLLAHADESAVIVGTVMPWPYGDEVVAGPYARAPAGFNRTLGLPLNLSAPPHAYAPGDWLLLPPERFHARHPGLVGQATMAIAPAGAAAPGLRASPTPAAGAFYVAGAGQVTGSIHLVVAAVGLTVAVLAGGVLALEVLARERDLATLEALGGVAAARRVVVQRAAVLVGAGVVTGVAAALVLTRVAASVLQEPGLRAPWPLVVETAAVTLLAGTLAGSVAGLRQLRGPLAARLGRRGPSTRPFPGPVRFLLVTPRLAGSAFASALVLGAVGSVLLSAAAVPDALFEPGEGALVVGRAEGNPFRGSADRFFGEHATAAPNITAASPETVAPTVLDGRPVVVRGVRVEGWRELEDARLLDGRWPERKDEATVGARLARVAGLEVGDARLVPGAYRGTLRWLTIVGVHEGAGLADDELVTDLDTAGDLAGLGPREVHFVRLLASADAVREAEAGGVLVTALAVDPPSPVPLTEARALVDVVNLGPSPASRTLSVRVNDAVAASRVVVVEPRTARTEVLPFLVPEARELHVQVNPEVNVTTTEPSLVVSAPETLQPGEAFDVRVAHRDGSPAGGAIVEAGEQRAVADGAGVARLVAPEPGPLLLTARLGALSGGRQTFVVEPERALSPRLAAEGGSVMAEAHHANGTAQYTLGVTLANVGGATFDGPVVARANGAEVARIAVVLEPRARSLFSIDVFVPEAVREVEVVGLRVSLVPPPPPPGSAAPPPPPPPPVPGADVSTVAGLLQSRRDKPAPSTTGELSGRAFLEDVFAELEPSVTVILLASFVHAAAGVVAAVLREVRERGEVVAVLGQLGATPDDLAARAARDALVAALPPLLAGAGVALLALQALQPWGFPSAFGHTIPLTADAAFYLRAVGGLAVAAAVAAAWAAKARPEAPPQQVPRQPLAQVLGEGL